jgi:hypothetical protein
LNRMDRINLSAIREIYGKLVWSHKTHEKALERWSRRKTLFNILNVALLVLASGSAIGALVKNERCYFITTAILSTISLFVIVYELNLDIGNRLQRHKKTASRLWMLREQYLSLIVDIMNERFSNDEVARQRDTLLGRLNEVYEDAPPTSAGDYKKAAQALKINQEATFDRGEIDALLPKELRLDDDS